MNDESARELGLLGFNRLDTRTLIFTSCHMLEEAGYSGAFSGPVINEIERRHEIVVVKKKSPRVFFEVIHELVDAAKDDSLPPDSLLKRVRDQKFLLGKIRESNGELMRSPNHNSTKVMPYTG